MNGLEPVISANLMDYHYRKHHETYVNNLNLLQKQAADALEKEEIQRYIDLS